MNRTLQSLLAIPAAVIMYFVTGIICGALPYLMNMMSELNAMRGLDQGYYVIEIAFNWLMLFLIYSIFPVFSSNIIMNLILEGETRPMMKVIPKVIFSTFGVLLFILATISSMAVGTATAQLMAGYMLSITSFVAVPIYLSNFK